MDVNFTRQTKYVKLVNMKFWLICELIDFMQNPMNHFVWLRYKIVMWTNNEDLQYMLYIKRFCVGKYSTYITELHGITGRKNRNISCYSSVRKYRNFFTTAVNTKKPTVKWIGPLGPPEYRLDEWCCRQLEIS